MYTLDKDRTVLREVIFPYYHLIDPARYRTKRQREIALNDPRTERTEYMVERIIGALGKFTWLPNGHGEDYDDGTDCKFVGTRKEGPYPTCPNPRVCAKIDLKHAEKGHLRTVVYNHVKGTCDFIFIPKRKHAGQNLFNLTYTPKHDSYNQLDNYRVESIEKLAKATARMFSHLK